MEEKKSAKKLVNENVIKHDDSRDAIPTPCGRGSGCVRVYEYYNHRGGVNSSIDSQNPSPLPYPARRSIRRGEGTCFNNSGISQSLIKVNDLTSYRLNVLTTLKKAAFTLAEILVTLAVIGIVAAMTIPNLVQSYNEKVTVTKVKKMYAVLSNAYEMSKLENEQEFIPQSSAGVKKLADMFKPHLKVAKDCGTADLSCLADTNYKLKSGQNTYNYNRRTAYYKLILNDGSVLILRGGSTVEKCNFEILYDVNGKKGPNQWGYDLFEFDENNGKIVPCGFLTDWTQACPIGETGYDCTAWIISKGNMDYLKN